MQYFLEKNLLNGKKMIKTKSSGSLVADGIRDNIFGEILTESI